LIRELQTRTFVIAVYDKYASYNIYQYEGSLQTTVYCSLNDIYDMLLTPFRFENV